MKKAGMGRRSMLKSVGATVGLGVCRRARVRDVERLYSAVAAVRDVEPAVIADSQPPRESEVPAVPHRRD